MRVLALFRADYINTQWMRNAGRSNKLPAYDTFLSMKGPQPWPERDDLTKPFKFGEVTYKP